MMHSPTAHTHRATDKPVLTYSAGEECSSYHEPISRLDFPSSIQCTYDDSWWMIADELAEDFHSNHDGWESSWPLQIRIYKDAVEVARFQVEREYEPTFIAHELELPVSGEQVGTQSQSDGVNQT